MAGSGKRVSAIEQVQLVDSPKGDLFHWRTFDPAMLAGGLNEPLATELVTYRDNLDHLLEHAGEFVIIKGDRIVGYHRSRKDALDAAFREFGRDPVLIKQVVEDEPVRYLGGMPA